MNDLHIDSCHTSDIRSTHVIECMISGSLRTLSKAQSAAWQALHGCTPSSQAAIRGPASQLCIGSWLMPDLAMATQRVQVRLMFGSTIKGSSGDLVDRQIEVRADGSDTLLQVKEKISVCTGAARSQSVRPLCRRDHTRRAGSF